MWDEKGGTPKLLQIPLDNCPICGLYNKIILAGIYLHIPFCKQACTYCDFYFSTSLKQQNELVNCLVKELESRKRYLKNKKITSIYFGGGTPSVLTKNELYFLLKTIFKHYNCATKIEITLEANPDDLTFEKLEELKEIGVNRLSIGIQSFNEKTIKWMNRSHTISQSLKCVKEAQSLGFDNISIDLIYGIPNLTKKAWQNEIKTALKLGIQHVSAYCLTVEKKTVLQYQVKKNEIVMPVDNEIIAQFNELTTILAKHDFEQYEISNFCIPTFESKHNSSYWLQKEYLGIGPSAHSFNGDKRRWNVANNTQYMKAIIANKNYFETEKISTTTAYNEYILTRLRTKWGVDSNDIKLRFGEKINTYFKKEIIPFLVSNKVVKKQTNYTLTQQGKIWADGIASELFFIEV